MVRIFFFFFFFVGKVVRYNTALARFRDNPDGVVEDVRRCRNCSKAPPNLSR